MSLRHVKLTEGQRIRVKSTPETRKYGIRVPGPHIDTNDGYAWPKEIGEVVRVPYTASDGESMAYWFIQFSRGRRLTVELPETDLGVDYVDATYCELIDIDADYFLLVK